MRKLCARAAVVRQNNPIDIIKSVLKDFNNMNEVLEYVMEQLKYIDVKKYIKNL